MNFQDDLIPVQREKERGQRTTADLLDIQSLSQRDSGMHAGISRNRFVYAVICPSISVVVLPFKSSLCCLDISQTKTRAVLYLFSPFAPRNSRGIPSAVHLSMFLRLTPKICASCCLFTMFPIITYLWLCEIYRKSTVKSIQIKIMF